MMRIARFWRPPDAKAHCAKAANTYSHCSMVWLSDVVGGLKAILDHPGFDVDRHPGAVARLRECSARDPPNPVIICLRYVVRHNPTHNETLIRDFRMIVRLDLSIAILRRVRSH